jgi:hypothetical protein
MIRGKEKRQEIKILRFNDAGKDGIFFKKEHYILCKKNIF